MILVSPREGNNLTVISAGSFWADIAEDGTPVPAAIDVPGSVSVTAAGTIYAVTVTAGDTASLDAGHIDQADRDRDAFILADSVSVSVRDDLGTSADPFLVDTNSGRTGAGTLSIRARSAVVNELSGDVTLKDVRTEGDFTLNVPGSVTDGNGTQDNAAAAAQAALDEAAEHAAAAAAAVKVLEDHENRTGTLTAEDRAKLNAARDELTAAQAALAQAAEAARAAKEAAAQTESTVQTGGGMNLTAGGSVGENGHGLSVDTAGVVSVTAGADVHLTSDTGLSVNIDAGAGSGDVSIAAQGDVSTAQEGSILADRLSVNSTGGSAGGAGAPLNLSVNRADVSAQNVTLTNDRNLEIGTIHASGSGQGPDGRGDVSLAVEGSVTQASGAGIYGGSLSANVLGDFGTADRQIDINAQTADITASNIGISNHSGSLGVRNLTGSDVTVTADGDIVGSGEGKHITADSLTTRSEGTTGKASESDTQLDVDVKGNVSQSSEYGLLNTAGTGSSNTIPQDQGDQPGGSSSDNPIHSSSGDQTGNIVPVPASDDTAGQNLFATARGKKGKVKLSWTEVKGATGYVVYMATGNKKNYKVVATTGAGTLNTVIRKLKKNGIYNFRIVALKGQAQLAESPVIYSVAGKSAKGGRSEARSIKVKKKLTIKLGRKKKILAKVRRKAARLLKYVKDLRYFVEDPAVVSVNAKGKVKALKKGTTRIWLLTVNGIWKAVTITVA